MRMVLLIAALLLSTCGCDHPTLRFSSTTPRIVSLAPSVTETLFALGVGHQVVGVSQYDDFPPSVRSLPKVGSFLTPNVEAIAALRPTLVIGLVTSSDLREIRALQAMGIATAMADDSSVAAIEESILLIGDQVNRRAAARQFADQLRNHIARVEQRLRNLPRCSVLMLVGHQPLVAVGRGVFLDELLTAADAHNIAAASNEAWPRLSLEYIIATRPEVILDGQMGSDPTAPNTFWSSYPTIPAVRDYRVYGYPESPTLHPGPRIGDTLDLLARRIHPEVFDHRAHIQ